MKNKTLAVSILALLFSAGLYASITLNAGSVLTSAVGGVNSENDNASAATYMDVDWQVARVRLFYQYGNVNGSVFNSGQLGGRVMVTVDLVTGAWQSTNGASGTLGAASLTNLQTTVKNWRNSAETFAVNQSIFSGSQVAW